MDAVQIGCTLLVPFARIDLEFTFHPFVEEGDHLRSHLIVLEVTEVHLADRT